DQRLDLVDLDRAAPGLGGEAGRPRAGAGEIGAKRGIGGRGGDRAAEAGVAGGGVRHGGLGEGPGGGFDQLEIVGGEADLGGADGDVAVQIVVEGQRAFPTETEQIFVGVAQLRVRQAEQAGGRRGEAHGRLGRGRAVARGDRLRGRQRAPRRVGPAGRGEGGHGEGAPRGRPGGSPGGSAAGARRQG
ncbi:MAG: hypothetical protein ACK559_12730, partial [bacterium]